MGGVRGKWEESDRVGGVKESGRSQVKWEESGEVEGASRGNEGKWEES